MTNSNGVKRKASDGVGGEEDVCDAKRPRVSAENACEDENTPPHVGCIGGGVGDDPLISPVRRKGPQLWSPKLRWKDERKRVLKISMNKLRTIEDPETFLRRSVLINNTMKRLQKEIRDEKNARHGGTHSPLHDPFGGVVVVVPPSSDADLNIIADGWTSLHPSNNSDDPKECRFSRRTCSSAVETASCDEIFGVNEDYLRINLPERISVSPSLSSSTSPPSDKMTVTTTSAPEHDASPPNSHQNLHQQHSNSTTTLSTTSSASATSTPSCPCTGATCSCSGRIKTNPRFYDAAPTMGGGARCCSAQYRNGQDALYFGGGVGDGSYCPAAHMPSSCVDSVIYHSLLASLES